MHLWYRCTLACASLSLLVLGSATSATAADPAYNVIVRKQISTHPGTNDVWGYTSPGGVELAIWGHRDGTAFVDASDPDNPVEVFNLPGPTSTWRDMKTYLNYCYIVTEGPTAGTGMQIVDLTDPLNPVHLSTYTGSGMTTAHNIWIDTGAGVAYACGGSTGGTHVLSLADPENPVQLDYFTPYYIHDLYVANGRGYAGAINSGTLRIMDVSNPANPVTIGTQGYPGAATHSAFPNASGTHVITADETGGGHLQVWDITNLSNIQFVSEVFGFESAIIHNVFGVDDMMYCAWYSAGTRIVDVSVPEDPIEVGYYDTSLQTGSSFQGNWGVYPYRADNILYSTDRGQGLFILEFTGDFAGQVSGVVREAGSGTPLLDAQVHLLGSGGPFITAADGTYGDRLSGGTYDVVTTRFGYVSDTTSVVVPPKGAVVLDVDLDALPLASAEVTYVSALTGAPVPGLVVDVLGTPVTGLVSDGSGMVTLSGLPVDSPWSARAGRFGFATTQSVVTTSTSGTTSYQVMVPAGFDDDFEIDQAWTSGAAGDNATDGLWERAIPVGSYFLGPVGPDEDASPTGEGFAFVTESHPTTAFVGASDVDGGRTTMLSPVFDGTGFGALSLSYSRWFSNRAPTPSSDEFRADVSTDAGGSWTNLETVSLGTDSWADVVVDLSIVTPSTQMQLRFVAEDLGSDTYVEAGVDDVRITSAATATPTVDVARPETELRLRTVGGNPFRTSTAFEFDLPSDGPVRLSVFDIAGRSVATLLRGERVAAGQHRAQWTGRDDTGALVAPGIYFVQLETPAGTTGGKVTFVR
ncbi:MAG: hypothetical protein DHS20C21_06080 [Gemmatimonadota bacterium]|nr:MAG: hypothetical protein DHS20C21_06080 [Gemmatimonadota bacterium]